MGDLNINMDCLTDRLMDRLQSMWCSVRYAWAIIKAYWRFYIAALVSDPSEFMLHKVIAINEDTGADAIVTRTFDASNWVESTRVATKWTQPNIRLEVRYFAHGRKYRLVLRPGDRCTLASIPERHRGGPKGVMAAELIAKEHVLGIDVTRRIQKYQGPGKDFHSGLGLRVAVADMFPYDDLNEIRSVFSTLVVIDAHANTVNIPIDCTDIAAALKKA